MTSAVSLITLALLAVPGFAADDAPPSEELRVMTCNLWQGGEAGGQPLEQSVEVIRQSRADVVGLQETAGIETEGVRPDNGAKIAQALGWHHRDQGNRTAVISRYPIVSVTEKKLGVTIELPSGRRVRMFNVHFNHAPYQPYQLLGIPYADAPFIKTAEEAVAAAQAARGEEVERLVSELRPAMATKEPVFVTGDFNEPSHLDWTPAAVAAGHGPIVVNWPTTRAVTEMGLRDALRTVRPDPVKDPAWTWTPITQPSDPKDKHDRIDFVFTSCREDQIREVQIVGERADAADVVVPDYPSDHRAVVVRVQLGDG